MKYHIYTLSDPRDGSIKYVGVSQNAFKRYGAHLTGTGTDGAEKTAWIDDLISQEMLPILAIIDRVNGKAEAFTKETDWIKKLTREGAVLLNKVCVVQRTFADPKKHREAIEHESERLREARMASRAEDEAAVKMLRPGDTVVHKGIIKRNQEKWTVLEIKGSMVCVDMPRDQRQHWFLASCLECTTK